MALNQNIASMERFSAVTVTDISGNTVMTLRFAEFIEAITAQVNQSIVRFGSGSPESSVEAQPGKLYMDSDSDQLYIKKTGSGNTGWIAV